MKLIFELEKETRSTLRFKEISENPVVGVLYIKKSALKTLDYESGCGIEMQLNAVKY